MIRLLPHIPQSVYINLRVICMSRLTPVLVLLLVAAAYVLHIFLPHEPSQGEIVQAFSGYQSKSFEIGPSPYQSITKKKCDRVREADGYLCVVQYKTQRLGSRQQEDHTQVFRLFRIEGGKGSWGQQVWNKNVEQYVAADARWREGHELWTLIAYTISSAAGAVLLCIVLPGVPWLGAGMNEQATPWAYRSARSGSSGADKIADGFTDAANNLTPAGAMALFSLALGMGGFLLGAWVLPQLFIDLRFMGWIERLCLLTAGVSMFAVGFSLPMLLIRLAAFMVVLLAMYAVFGLPAAWILTGNSPAQTIEKNIDFFNRLVTPSNLSVASEVTKPTKDSATPRRKGFEGYLEIFDF